MVLTKPHRLVLSPPHRPTARAFKPDGVIMFSDILTPLTGMGIPFDILEKQGPVVTTPIRSMEQVKQVRQLVPQESVAYAGQALGALKQELAGTGAAVLGFVGAPFTLATYIVEGGTTACVFGPPPRPSAPALDSPVAAAAVSPPSSHRGRSTHPSHPRTYLNIKKMAFGNPQILHALLVRSPRPAACDSSCIPARARGRSERRVLPR